MFVQKYDKLLWNLGKKLFRNIKNFYRDKTQFAESEFKPMDPEEKPKRKLYSTPSFQNNQ